MARAMWYQPAEKHAFSRQCVFFYRKRRFSRKNIPSFEVHILVGKRIGKTTENGISKRIKYLVFTRNFFHFRIRFRICISMPGVLFIWMYLNMGQFVNALLRHYCKKESLLFFNYNWWKCPTCVNTIKCRTWN